MGVHLECRRCRGFTLMELIVVITIILLLLALMLPSLGRARAEVRSVVCQSNLRQLSAASREHNIAYASKPRGLGLASNAWVGQLGEMLTSGRVFACPEGNLDPQTGSVLEPGGAVALSGQPLIEAAVAQLHMRCYWDYTRALLYWDNLSVVKNPVGSSPNGPGYFDSGSDGLTDPHSSTYYLNDGVDTTGTDCTISYTDNGNNTLTATYVGTGAATRVYELLSGDNVTDLADIGPGGKTPAGTTGLIRIVDINRMGSGVVPSFPGSVVVYLGSTSYGMNSACDPPANVNRSNVIFLLDYPKAKADPTADLVNWQTAGTKNAYMTPQFQYTFGRHLGKANVLWTDGSVTSVNPATIVPTPSGVKTWWTP